MLGTGKSSRGIEEHSGITTANENEALTGLAGGVGHVLAHVYKDRVLSNVEGLTRSNATF